MVLLCIKLTYWILVSSSQSIFIWLCTLLNEDMRYKYHGHKQESAMIGLWVKCGWYHQLITSSYWLYHDQHHEYSCVWFSCMALGHWQIHGWQGVSRRVGFSWRSGVCSEAWRHTAWGHAFPWQSVGSWGTGVRMNDGKPVYGGVQIRVDVQVGHMCWCVCLNMCDVPFFAHLGKSSPQWAEQACVRCYAMDVTLMVGLAQEILVFVKNGNDLLTLILFQTRMLLLWPSNAKGDESSCCSFHSYHDCWL